MDQHHEPTNTVPVVMWLSKHCLQTMCACLSIISSRLTSGTRCLMQIAQIERERLQQRLRDEASKASRQEAAEASLQQALQESNKVCHFPQHVLSNVATRCWSNGPCCAV